MYLHTLLGFCAVNNLQVSAAAGLKMLALEETTNTSQPIFGEKLDLGITSSKVSRNVSLPVKNSTSQHYDHLERSTGGSENASHEIGNSTTSHHNDLELSKTCSKNVSLEIGNSTSSQHHDLELNTKGSKNVSLQVANSTSHYTSTPDSPIASGSQPAETLSKNSSICLLTLWKLHTRNAI